MAQQLQIKMHRYARQRGSIKQNLLVILLVMSGILLFASYMLPQGYHSDTTQIGKGKPAIVLIYDANNAVSDQIMEDFSQVRGEFEAQVEFILVDVNAPGGSQFANANAVSTASALFFDSKGKRITTIYSPQGADTLNKIIRQTFGL